MIEISDEEIQKALECGELLISIGEPQKRLLTEEEKKKREKTKTRNIRISKAFIQAPDEQLILDLWNNSRFISSIRSGEIADSRNCTVSQKDLPIVLPLIKKSLRDIGSERIKYHLEKYFECCGKGGHIWDGANHGFKHLGGFLTKIMNCEKSSQMPWWESSRESMSQVIDPDPEITQYVADKYSEEFLCQSKFDLSQSEKEHRRFVAVANLVKRIEEAVTLPTTEPFDSILKWIFKCARNSAESMGSVVSPGSLTSGYLWRIVIPQFLSENVGLTSVQISKICEIYSEVTSGR